MSVRLTRQPRPRTQRVVEPLEPRLLLATVAFDINLYADSAGTIGDPLLADSVQVGESFFVEITAREYHPMLTGLQGVSLDIKWDSAVLQEIDTVDVSELITSELPLYRAGTLDNDAGSIENLRGSASPATDDGRAIGNLSAERFALLHFRAVGQGDVAISLSEGASRIATMPVSSLRGEQLDFDQAEISVLTAAGSETGGDSNAVAGEPSPESTAETGSAAESSEPAATASEQPAGDPENETGSEPTGVAVEPLPESTAEVDSAEESNEPAAPASEQPAGEPEHEATADTDRSAPAAAVDPSPEEVAEELPAPEPDSDKDTGETIETVNQPRSFDEGPRPPAEQVVDPDAGESPQDPLDLDELPLCQIELLDPAAVDMVLATIATDSDRLQVPLAYDPQLAATGALWFLGAALEQDDDA